MSGRPDDERLRAIFNRIEAYLERRYGIPVIITDVPNPFSGDLDGAEIHVDHEEDIASAVFIVAHLFGHTVQWNVAPETRELGSRVQASPTPDQIEALRLYETEACRYSVRLFHDAGVHDCDQWLSDFSACDLAYLEHFYRTGEKRPFTSFWRDGAPLVEPKEIPDFHPTRWMSRWEGIVI